MRNKTSNQGRDTIRRLALLFILLSLVVITGLDAPILAQTASSGWAIQEVARGTKPTLALDSENVPHIAYMLERTDGWVRFASPVDDSWAFTNVTEGYFYGPLDVAFNSQDEPHIVYHDHQDPRFNPMAGDATLALRVNGEWEVQTFPDVGHDGWDGSVIFDEDDVLHIAAVDPVDFNGDGVEYYRRTPDGEFTVEDLDTGFLSYAFGTSIALDLDGRPLITYYEQFDPSLSLATRIGEDEWEIEVVDDEGDTGLFSSMAIDAEGGIHISYFENFGDGTGRVLYTYRASPDADWQRTEIDALDSLTFGHTGARDVTALVLDSDGLPRIAYGDEAVVKLATFDGESWSTETVATADEDPLGHIVSLKLDADDNEHLAFATVTNLDDLDGFIYYATRE